jgi:DNA-binding MarR family transcriptional regulator
MRFERAGDGDEVVTAVLEDMRLCDLSKDVADQAVAERLGLNRTDARCLAIIDRHGGVTAGRLAAESGLTSGATTTVLDRLERAGLARRVAHPEDRRRVLVESTSDARERLAALEAPLTQATARQLERYTADQIGLLRDFMHDIRRLYDEQAAALRARQEGEAASS